MHLINTHLSYIYSDVINFYRNYVSYSNNFNYFIKAVNKNMKML